METHIGMSYYIKGLVGDIHKASTRKEVDNILRDRHCLDGHAGIRASTYVNAMVSEDTPMDRYKDLCARTYTGYVIIDSILRLVDPDACISVRSDLPYMLGTTIEDAFSFMDSSDLQVVIDKEEDMSLVMMKHSSKLLSLVVDTMGNRWKCRGMSVA